MRLRTRIAEPYTHGAAITGDGTHAERRLEVARLGRAMRKAAVLILLIGEPESRAVVLTQRTAELKNHAGQISFPGGRQDDADADLVATALREAQEEIGADTSQVEIVGSLPQYVTISAFEVTPIVAVSATLTIADFTPDPAEVADVFSVPLAHFFAEENWRRDHMLREGVKREFWAAPYATSAGERYIWGATAGMMRGFALHLRGD